MSKIIGGRTFEPVDLLWFARASGDWNPIHVDPISARRYLAGKVVIHGMYSLLWALDSHLATGGVMPQSLSARFLRSISPGEALEVHRFVTEDQSSRLAILRDGEEVSSILVGGGGKKIKGRIGQVSPTRGNSLMKTFDEMRDNSGIVSITAVPAELAFRFPAACEKMGEMPVAAIMALSQIVGMECPGLNSLLTGLDLFLDHTSAEREVHWKVVRHTTAHAPLTINVHGGGLTGKIDAFARPKPVDQPSMDDVADIVPPGIFKNHRALVIGGSRGLGEVVAKLIAAGGGNVVITYMNGSSDAERVAQSISNWGGKCRSLQADVEQSESLVERLLGQRWTPTHLYYFATPRILGQRNDSFNAAMHDAFSRIYVHAFQRLVISLASKCSSDIWVFYPSTVFLDELPRDFTEYIVAKAAGEALCRHLNRHIRNIRILVSRLPKLKTDQTATLLPLPLKPVLPEMERVVKEMHALMLQEK